jgi:hypothetical protein
MNQKMCQTIKEQSKLDEYLCFAIQSHGNHGKLLLFQSYECQGIQTKNQFDEILSISFDLRPLKVNNNALDKS